MRSINVVGLFHLLVSRWSFLLFVLVLLGASVLRLHGVNWDAGYSFHPDERSIYLQSDCIFRLLKALPYQDCLHNRPEVVPGFPSVSVFFDSEKSPLNPHWFPIGSVILYLPVVVRFVLEPFADFSALDMRYIMRPLAVFADIGCIVFVYLIGKRIYGHGVALLAAFLIAISVIHIQNSHFYRPETMVVLFSTASLWAMLRVLDHNRVRDWIILGVGIGLAFATKVTVLPLLIPLGVTFIFCAFAYDVRCWVPERKTWWLVLKLVIAFIVALAIFAFWTPYAFLDASKFLNDIFWESSIAREAGKMPYTVQYIGTIPFWYELRQSSVWALGVPLGVTAWLGVLFSVYASYRYKNRKEIILLCWVVPVFVVVSLFEVKFLRYVFPIIPIIILFGARLLVEIINWAKINYPKSVYYIKGLVVFIVLSTALFSIAFQSVYANPHTAVQASLWIRDNIPNSALILTDNHWDEGIPNLGEYSVKQIEIYEQDSLDKMNRLSDDLVNADYIIFYSNRTYGSISRYGSGYPYSARYYNLLFAGNLGYVLEKEFTSHPKLLGITFEDDPFTRAGLDRPVPRQTFSENTVSFNLGYADGNVINYDHPRVLIFKKTKKLSRIEMGSLLSRQINLPNAPVRLLLDQDAIRDLEASGTWSETFHDNSWTNRYPIVALLLFVELVYLLTLPLGYFLFRGLPDRGLIFARLVGLIAISFIVWSMASFQWMSFSVLSIWISLLAIFGVSSLIMWQCKKDFLAFLKEKWKLLLTAEVLFIIAFLLFVLIRMANPDLWHPFRGGEKPMDLAYLTAVTKSNFMPPYDPWFASGHLNYYYWGFFLMGVLAKATGIIPVIFYNLAIPFLFALTVTGAFSIIYNLTEGARHRVASSKSMIHSECWFSSPVLAGLVGSIFVCVIGNLDGIVQIFQAGWSSVVSGGTLTDFDFWRSSRMIPELTSNSSSMVGSVSPHITEFPYFSFLFADLHPHVIAIPVTLLTIGLTLNTVSMLKSDKYWVVVPSLIALSIVLGSLWAINTWDFPAYALFAVCGIGIGLLFTEKSFRSRVTLFSLSCTLVILVSFMAFLPFHVSYEMFGGFIQRSFWQTPLPSFLLIHGLFLVIICTFMWVIAYPRFREIYRELTLKRFKGYSVSENESKSLVILLAFVTGVAVIAIIYSALTSHWNGALLIAVLYLTIFSGIVALKDSGTFQRSFVILMICVGILIAIGVDFIRIGDDIGRMNTVFKFYIQVWILFALAAAFGLWYVFHSKFINVNKISLSQLGWLGIVGALILCGLTYTVFGTSDRMRDRFGGMSFTLDGSKYMDTASHVEDGEKFDLRWDKSAIEWLQLNVVGTPVVLEAATNQYRWGSRVSQYTGLPTILGWPWHQIQQRKDYSNDIEVRKNTVSTMYNSPNEVIVLALLRKYRVKYVIVGPLERIRYTSTGLEKFDRMVGRDMELVYENPGVKIFEVIDVPNSDPA